MLTQEDTLLIYSRIFGDYLWQDSVTEIYLNGDGSLWVDDSEVGVIKVRENTEQTIVAKFWEMLPKSDAEQLIFEGELPHFKARLECIRKPLFVGESFLIFSIRKQALKVFSLQNYRDSGILTPIKGILHNKKDILASSSISFKHPIDVILQAVVDKKNIIVVGGTGSGKTTLTNAILDAISSCTPNDRVITIEDTLELQVNVPNKLSLRTNKDVDIKKMLQCCMRLHPNRIIVGEVRGSEAYSLLKAWNSGHPGGIATLHANNARESLDKLSHYIYEDSVAQSFSHETVCNMIANSVDLIVVIEYNNKYQSKRKITEICEVKGYANGRFNLSILMYQSLTGLCEFKPQI